MRSAAEHRSAIAIFPSLRAVYDGGVNLSLVIPVYNEAESLEGLYWELDQVAHAEGYELDVIFVDDGSSDGSWRAIAELAGRDLHVRGIRFRRNFGKAAALSAGFAAARHDVVLT